MENKEVQKIEEVAHKTIYDALSAFQGELTPIERSAKVKFKTKAGDQVDFNYAPLEEIVKVIYPLLKKHGLSFRHHLTEGGIECILNHKSYERVEIDNTREVITEGRKEVIKSPTIWEENVLRSGRLPIDTKNGDMKIVGANITYGRRYTLGMVLGIVTEEDKDAQMLEEQSKQNTKKFAFQKVKEAIEKASEETIQGQISLLEKDKELAQAVADGSGKKAPSLGLEVAEYDVLLKIAKERQEALSTEEPKAKK